MARDLFVVTHAQATHHIEGVVGGWHDSELTPLGRRQAEAIATRIGELTAGAAVEVWSSDLKRAAQTAAPICAQLGVEARLTPGLREKSFGVAGGRPVAWLDEHWRPTAPDDCRLDHPEGVDGAETRRDLMTRVTAAMDEITARDCPVQIIVTHGFALTFVIAAWFRLPVESAGWIGFRPLSGGITHLQQDDRFRDRSLLSFNEQAHLAGVS